MPRRYGADGTRLWNGKTPEEFTEADAYRFMVETEAVLQRKELMDDPAQPAPATLEPKRSSNSFLNSSNTKIRVSTEACSSIVPS